LKPVSQAGQDSQKLLYSLAAQLIKLFGDSKFPFQLKLFLIPLLFMIPLYSIMIVVYLGDLIYCIAAREHFNPSYYLVFLGTSAPVTIGLLLTFGVLAHKFENGRTLEEQLQTVTDARQPRRQKPRSAVR